MIAKTDMQLLLARILERTADNELDWIPIDDSAYRCGFPKSSAISNRKLIQGFMVYELSILNGEGNEVGELSTMMANENRELYRQLRTLFVAAESNALRIDETLKDILNGLQLDGREQDAAHDVPKAAVVCSVEDGPAAPNPAKLSQLDRPFSPTPKSPGGDFAPLPGAFAVGPIPNAGDTAGDGDAGQAWAFEDGPITIIP